MTSTVRSWYISGADFESAPSARAQLERAGTPTDIGYSELLATEKWEHLFQGKRTEQFPGWALLGDLALTRRGIATGANNFFLLSLRDMEKLNLRRSSALPCIGRAKDVRHFDFSMEDFEALADSDGKTQLLNFSENVTADELSYINKGEALEIHKRYIPANRDPWYSMEQREVAPIWVSVFGRGNLKFVLNSAKVRSLTNFHCIYPANRSEEFCQALVFCLNMPSVRALWALHTRNYGGGLTKFEPNDLRAISVPDLRAVSSGTIGLLSAHFEKLDEFSRRGKVFPSEWDQLVLDAAVEAHTAPSGLF